MIYSNIRVQGEMSNRDEENVKFLGHMEHSKIMSSETSIY